MTRYVSFGVLIAVILLLCIIFYRVMASFLLPLFLATILVVVFRPVHDWVLEKCKGKKGIASAITTTIISLAVIVPVGVVGVIAVGEARQMFKSLTAGGIEQNVKRIRKSLRLEMPAPRELHALEEVVRALDIRNIEDLDETLDQLKNIAKQADPFSRAVNVSTPSNAGSTSEQVLSTVDLELWTEFIESIKTARKKNEEYRTLLQELQKNSSSNMDSETKGAVPGKGPSKTTKLEPDKGVDAKKSPTEETLPKSSEEESAKQPDEDSIQNAIQEFEDEYKIALADVFTRFDSFKSQLLGGKFYGYFKELANPTPEEFQKYNEALIDWIKENFLSLSGQTTQFLLKVVFNGMIMMIAVYFFLLDGSKMIQAFKFLSPLDDRHEQELIDEFGKVSRAVVVATLVAAAVQGILAGIGYYFAGVDAVFLLTMLTAVLALVPFIGAGSVWVPTCLYLYLVEDRLMPAILLAIWGAGVVSTVDNLIKPLILHGQSNIHPLFALLSVLGGVSALGPIGILVGPMVVVFLQTLLAILQRELKEMDSTQNGEQDEGSGPDEVAENAKNDQSKSIKKEKVQGSANSEKKEMPPTEENK